MSLPFEIPPVSSGESSLSPFTPSFGTIPPLLADRQGYINDFAYALDSGPGAMGRATLVTGQRGMGKSVMLKVFREVAASRQWVAVHSDAGPGFLRRLAESRIPEAFDELDIATKTKTRLSGVNLPFGAGGVSTTTQPTHPIVQDFEHQVIAILSLLAAHGTGLLITLDEVHHAQLSELRELTGTIAAAFSDGLPVAFAAAGLPSTINSLVNDEISTYLRRSARVELGNLSRDGVRRGLLAPIEDSGKTIGETALKLAVEGTGQYPYLVQLIGDQAWRNASDRSELTEQDVAKAVRRSRSLMFDQVHGPAFAELSEREREFMGAMSRDDSDSALRDIADRMGISSKHAGVFRFRLLAQGVIEAPARGRLRYAIPFSRDYYRQR